MDNYDHSLSELFAQLGLPNKPEQIDRFIESVRPLPAEVSVETASLWSESQASFLREALQADSDWAEVVDQLNMDLH